MWFLEFQLLCFYIRKVNKKFSSVLFFKVSKRSSNDSLHSFDGLNKINYCLAITCFQKERFVLKRGNTILYIFYRPWHHTVSQYFFLINRKSMLISIVLYHISVVYFISLVIIMEPYSIHYIVCGYLKTELGGVSSARIGIATHTRAMPHVKITRMSWNINHALCSIAKYRHLL